MIKTDGKNFTIKIAKIGLICCVLLLSPFTVFSDSWYAFESEYFRVYYQRFENLKELNTKVTFSNDLRSCPIVYQVSSENNFEKELKEKMDTLFEQVQHILAIQTLMKKITVFVYPDHQSLQKSYRRITKNNDRMRAWYILGNNSIYLNIQDIYTSILAHEIAHAIVGNSEPERPSRVTSERLAQYVDKHFCSGVNFNVSERI